MNQKLKAGIIGMGKMGRIRLKEMQGHNGFETVAITDIDPKVAKEFPSIKFCDDWKEVLDQSLDVVFVCTYNQFIPEITVEALNRGLHVFSEKPPGRSVSDIEMMRNAEEKAGDRVLKFGFN
ncbi:MAG: Gfo/Idh/MocA family oxidoreductase, partial [Pseudomonadota bacterium]